MNAFADFDVNGGYCSGCGDESWYCGCPLDTHANDKMVCPHCRNQWWREYGSVSTTCLHRACGKEGSTVLVAALYAPRRDINGKPLDGEVQP